MRNTTKVIDDDDDDDSLLHIFALKMNYKITKYVYIGNKKKILKFTHFEINSGLQVYCENLQLLQLLRNLKRYKFRFKNLALFKK